MQINREDSADQTSYITEKIKFGGKHLLKLVNFLGKIEQRESEELVGRSIGNRIESERDAVHQADSGSENENSAILSSFTNDRIRRASHPKVKHPEFGFRFDGN